MPCERITLIQRTNTLTTRKRAFRLSFAALLSVPVVSTLLFTGFVLLRIPFRAAYPVNWDAVQLALGTQSFNLHHHQPHPPGYIGFIGLGWFINRLTDDAILSLTMLSIVAGALAPMLMFLYARSFLSDRFAFMTALLFGVSPLIWYYSEVALTYSAEAAAGIGFMLMAHRSIRNVSFRDLIIATVLLSLVGSLRQSAMIFLIPVWIYCAWQFPWKERLQSATTMSVVSGLWALPLIWLSGGLSSYLRESRALADLIGGQTSILSLNFAGLQMNATFVLAGILIGLNLGLVIIAVSLALGVRPLRRFSRQDRIFYLLWFSPALATFLLGHTGQLGYILLLLPPLFLLVGICIEDLCQAGVVSASRLRQTAVTAAVAAFAVVSMLGFLVAPAVAYDMAQPGEDGLESRASLHLRQYDLETSDAHWASFSQLVGNYRPENTVILTTVGGPRISGSFRHASYLQPDYRVYGLGYDIDGTFGYLFVAQNMRSDYSVEGLSNAQPWLPIDEDARWVIIPDQEILAWIDPQIERRTVTLEGGSTVTVAVIPPRTSLEFDRQEY